MEIGWEYVRLYIRVNLSLRTGIKMGVGIWPRKYIPGERRWENINQVGTDKKIYTRWEDKRKFIPDGSRWGRSEGRRQPCHRCPRRSNAAAGSPFQKSQFQNTLQIVRRRTRYLGQTWNAGWEEMRGGSVANLLKPSSVDEPEWFSRVKHFQLQSLVEYQNSRLLPL